MRRRYDNQLPLNGRPTPARNRLSPPPRRPARTSQPTPRCLPAQDGAPDDALATPGVELQLDNEIPTDELEYFAACVTASSDVIRPALPSFARLKTEYQHVLAEKKAHHNLTRQLVRAVEPILNEQHLSEAGKSGLLEVSALAVERVILLKAKEANLRERLMFLEQAIPAWLREHAERSGHSGPQCDQLIQQAHVVLENA